MTFAFQGEEFRPDAYWKGLGLTGEADGRGKHERERWVEEPLWEEWLRHQWFEDELGMKVFRWVDREMRYAPDGAAARWGRLAARAEVRLWVPPPGLEIFRKQISRSSLGGWWLGGRWVRVAARDRRRLPADWDQTQKGPSN